jgi:predicted nucleic acid-binding protein
MILVDSSVWIDHFRKSDPALRKLLDEARVLCHPFIAGELAMGSLKHRQMILKTLGELPISVAADDQEVMHFITNRSLFGKGIGYIDAHLLASVHLTPQALLWTRDRRLKAIASKLSIASALP